MINEIISLGGVPLDQFSRAHCGVLSERGEILALSPEVPWLPSSLCLGPVLLSQGLAVLPPSCCGGNDNFHLYSAVDRACAWYSASLDPPNNSRVDVICI